MSEAIITVSHLGKRYRIAHQAKRQRYVALRDVIAHKLAAPFRALKERSWNSKVPPAASSTEDFWALKDVSFEVKRGEVMGIIGRNGAGKSTLLKILSRITEPTEGRVRIEGRVASLLEVGTGFHPELTGRENIFLNGAILGMHRAEIKQKFDEIVAFAEVEKFLDTPVKHYSSGMYVRLAFAVAAHLEPEILIVDEVLAVGDAQFQKKCLGKMDHIAKEEGRTVLFVSHNMQAVSLLCSSAVLMQAGRVILRGPTSAVIDQYLSVGSRMSAEAKWPFDNAPGTSLTKLRAVRALDQDDAVCHDFESDRMVKLRAEFWILRRTRMTVSFHVFNQEGINLFASANLHDPEWGKHDYEPGVYACWCIIPAHFLNEGRHYVSLFLASGASANQVEIRLAEVVSFNMRDSGATRGEFVGEWVGAVRPLLAWGGECVSPALKTAGEPRVQLPM
jgi:lipopolysaccharide transport system ATP-binding protein